MQAVLAGAALSSLAQPAAAARHKIDIPAGRLSDALVALGRQAAVSIGAFGTDVASARVGRLRGTFEPEEALKRLVAGSGFTFVRIDASTFRIVRASAKPERRVRPAPVVPRQPKIETPDEPIIVTGSKRWVPLEHFPGTVEIVDLQETPGSITGASGTANLLARLPTLSSTYLGRGRNKLFIRGVADSSFTGPTQATVGQYLGDVRLNYNAPDPDLSLYDIARVEVIEGPQGTLYGAGSLGGVLRLIPNAPILDKVAMNATAGISKTRHGSDGHDLAAMINLPLVGGRLGVRAVGYQVVEGGYIDDRQRRLADINRTRIAGARGSVRITPGDRWTIDLGALFQSIATRDSQYSDRDAPSLTRSSATGQPFDNDYWLWRGEVRKVWSGLELISATGFVRHDVDTRYDATRATGGAPIVFEEDNDIRLFTHETRISSGERGGTGWVAGIAVVSDIDRTTRRTGSLQDSSVVIGVRNATLEGSLFGEVSVPLTDSLSGTIGGRLAYSHLSGQPLAGEIEFEPSRDSLRVLPTAALAWRPGSGVLAFARYQEGFRAGGLSIGQSASTPTVQRFRSDRIRTIEAGVRLGRRDRDRMSGSATLSYARWNNIQADLVEPFSLPTTTNIGNGRIYGFEASGRWQPSANFTADIGIFLNDSGLTSRTAGLEDSDIEELPNIARAGISAAASWHTALTPAVSLSVEMSARYVGKSQLGVGPALDLSQGDYLDSAIDVRLATASLQFSIGLTNLTDDRANRFALGNPFGATAGRQSTPLRPRSVRIGVGASF